MKNIHPGAANPATAGRKRRFQFSLRSLFVMLTLLALSLGSVVRPAMQQHRAVAAIEALGGSVDYRESYWFPADGLLRKYPLRWLSRDCFDQVVGVDLSFGWHWFSHRRQGAMDADLSHVVALGNTLEWLKLNDSAITDTGMAQLSRLAKLQSLRIERSAVTEAGIARLQQLLPGCQIVP